jgi:anti-anti-sigma regulatory factor
MATIADWMKVDGAHVGETLREAVNKLSATESELVLDFSEVHRLDAKAVVTLEELAAKAKDRSVRVVLRGMNVGTYKVLKLARLDGQFGFLN